MRVQRSGAGVCVETPAKLNLFLEVMAKRDDGFHELCSLMTPIAWFDSLHLTPSPSGDVKLAVSCAVGGPFARPDTLPPTDQNLVVRAVRLLANRTGTQQGADLQLVKRIPMAAGLGGGSSDAAAALVAANLAWGLDWSHDRLSALAAELGSDVPFFLGTGSAVARGRGEQLEAIHDLPPQWFVIVCPPVGLSTAEVYKACQPSRTPRGVGPLIDALRLGRWSQVAPNLHNGLEPAAARLSPWIDRLRHEFSRTDCLAHQMSGSGTSYFGICRTARHARCIAGRLANRGLGQVRAVRSCSG